MSEKTIVKDIKMLAIEDFFNEEIDDILWRLRQIQRKSIEEIAKELSMAPVAVTVEEVADWLNFLDMDSLLDVKLTKPDPTKLPPPPKISGLNQADKQYDPSNISGAICTDDCIIAEHCRYYSRYFGKYCYVDTETKKDFLKPLKSYIDRTYSRDADIQQIFGNIADQVATIHQIMQRKVRHMNRKGITVIERKIDPSTGKVIENEVPNPLSSEILHDAKQITSMLKELGLTPKSVKDQDAGEADPSSLSKVLQIEEEKAHEMKHVVALKQQRYRERGEITSKEQLLALIQEKQGFDKKLSAVLQGEPPNEGGEIENPNAMRLDESEEEPPVNNENVPRGNKVLKGKANVEIPEEVQRLLDNVKNNGGKK